ncbi:MAG: phosphonate C-P lyase system protein PhnG [Pseudomonadota bacterium]
MIHEKNPNVLRQGWISVLAKADYSRLHELWCGNESAEEFQVLRKPETGLVMLRGRMGGTGAPFNMGEATVTRCSVRSETGLVGHSYVMGRNHDHAVIAAKLDARLQDEGQCETLMQDIIKPLEKQMMDEKQEHREKVAATKVDFFTMVRGED